MKQPESRNRTGNGSHRLVVFTLDEQRYALRLEVVERVVRVVETTPLPKAPAIVLGLANFRGLVLPVLNVRARFRLPSREIHLSDQLVLAHTANRPVVLWVDTVVGVIERSAAELVPVDRILPRVEYVEGVTTLLDALVLIHDLDKFLSLEEENLLGRALTDCGEARND